MLEQKLIAAGEDDRLRPTREGEAVLGECAERRQEVRAQIHAGITDEEYVTPSRSSSG